MLSKNKIKFLSSLKIRKHRDSSGMFLAEGEKIVKEILFSENILLKPMELFASEEFINEIPKGIFPAAFQVTPVTDSELRKISSLSSPNKAILLLNIPKYKPEIKKVMNSVSLVLEDIRDPGNLGTIIRTADWFGIHDIFCSMESVDLFNPKTVQSTMGAIARVKVHYADPIELVRSFRKDFKSDIIGTFPEGPDLHTIELPASGIIVFGNESQGISAGMSDLLTRKVRIPSYTIGNSTSESLNIASAVAIICWEVRRRINFIQNGNSA